MQILFTTSNTPGSKLIRQLTAEPVSHCALQYNNLVIHSTEGGVQIVKIEDFKKKNNIVYTGHIEGTAEQLLDVIYHYQGKGYDYGALLFLGVKIALNKCGINIKHNLWQSSGLFLCTEFVSSAIIGQADSTITPYQLKLKLFGDTI